MNRRINTAFELTPWEKTLLELRDAGMGPTEIARCLGISVSAAKAANTAAEKRDLAAAIAKEPSGGGSNTLAVARGQKKRSYDPRLGLWKHG